jgi:hypothetical protein
LDVKNENNSTQHTFSIDRALMAPSMGLSVKQFWPYAPYHEMIVALPYAARASLLFFAMAALTFLICGVPVDLRQFALLGGLFLLPFLVLMSGYVPYPEFITPQQFAGFQMKMLPVFSGFSLIIAFFHLRRLPRLPLVLVLVLMALAIGGYAFIGLISDVQKRNTAETLIQACLIGYIFFLTLYIRLRSFIASSKPVSKEPRPRESPTRWVHRIARIQSKSVYLVILLLVLALSFLLVGKFLNFGGPELPELNSTSVGWSDPGHWEPGNYIYQVYSDEFFIGRGSYKVTN